MMTKACCKFIDHSNVLSNKMHYHARPHKHRDTLANISQSIPQAGWDTAGTMCNKPETLQLYAFSVFQLDVTVIQQNSNAKIGLKYNTRFLNKKCHDSYHSVTTVHKNKTFPFCSCYPHLQLNGKTSLQAGTRHLALNSNHKVLFPLTTVKGQSL